MAVDVSTETPPRMVLPLKNEGGRGNSNGGAKKKVTNSLEMWEDCGLMIMQGRFRGPE